MCALITMIQMLIYATFKQELLTCGSTQAQYNNPTHLYYNNMKSIR